MTSKFITIFFYILICNNIQSQNATLYQTLDVDSFPILNCDIHQLGTLYSCVYIKINKERILVDNDIKYKEGDSSLQLFCDSIYYNIYGNDLPEINALAYYFILFDKNLIKEVRIFKRLGFNSEYDSLVKSLLFKTEGNWIEKNDQAKKWHVYFGRIRLR